MIFLPGDATDLGEVGVSGVGLGVFAARQTLLSAPFQGFEQL